MQSDFWSIAVSSGFYGRFDEQFLAECEENGIGAVELSLALHKLNGELDFEKNPQKAAQMAQKYGVKITSLHLPFWGKGVEIDLASPDELLRTESVQLQTALIRAAGQISIPIVVVHPCLEPVPQEQRDLRMEQAIKSFRDLVQVAEPLGIRIAAENLPRSCLCRTPQEMNRLLDAVPGLYVCFDTNHSLLQTNAEYIHAVADKIITLHVSDYDFIDERHLLPFEGKIDWPALLGNLRESDYRGLFTFESGWHETHTLEDLCACYDRLANL